MATESSTILFYISKTKNLIIQSVRKPKEMKYRSNSDLNCSRHVTSSPRMLRVHLPHSRVQMIQIWPRSGKQHVTGRPLTRCTAFIELHTSNLIPSTAMTMKKYHFCSGTSNRLLRNGKWEIELKGKTNRETTQVKNVSNGREDIEVQMRSARRREKKRRYMTEGKIRTFETIGSLIKIVHVRILGSQIAPPYDTIFSVHFS